MYKLRSLNPSIMTLDVKKDGKNVVVSINNKESVFTEELSDQISNLERLNLLKVIEVREEVKEKKEAPVTTNKFGRGRKKEEVKEEPIKLEEINVEETMTIEQDNSLDDNNDLDGGVLSG